MQLGCSDDINGFCELDIAIPSSGGDFFVVRLGKLWSWQITGFWEIAPKWLGEGAKGLWAQSGQVPFAPVKCWVAPVQNKVLVVQEPFSAPGKWGRPRRGSNSF